MPVIPAVVGFLGTSAGAATIAGGAALASAAISANASKKATNAQTAALQTANDTQTNEYNQTRADQAPWRDVGASALSQMAKLYGIQTHDINGAVTGGAAAAGKPDMSGFTASPDYQFALDQGEKAVASGYAARGAFDSGAEKKALVSFGQGQASQQYGNYFSKLAALAGYGTGANSQTEAAGQTAAGNISNNTIAIGNAQASGYNANANATNSALGSMTGILSQAWHPPAMGATPAPKASGGGTYGPVL